MVKVDNRAWSKYQNDFDAMTDKQVENEKKRSQDLIDEHEEFVEAVAAWEAAGRPRS